VRFPVGRKKGRKQFMLCMKCGAVGASSSLLDEIGIVSWAG